MAFSFSCVYVYNVDSVQPTLSLYLAESIFYHMLQAVIFVDNSGADIILGILPFARELLRRGTKVCLNLFILLLFVGNYWKTWTRVYLSFLHEFVSGSNVSLLFSFLSN